MNSIGLREWKRFNEQSQLSAPNEFLTGEIGPTDCATFWFGNLQYQNANQSVVSTNFVLTVSTLLTGTTSFTNPAAITIPSVGNATPYPSVITVSGMGGTVSNMTVTLRNLSHTWGNDVDVLLVGPGGRR